MLDAEEYTNCDVIGVADKDNFVVYIKEAFDIFDTKIMNIVEIFKGEFNSMNIFGDDEEIAAANIEQLAEAEATFADSSNWNVLGE